MLDREGGREEDRGVRERGREGRKYSGKFCGK